MIPPPGVGIPGGPEVPGGPAIPGAPGMPGGPGGGDGGDNTKSDFRNPFSAVNSFLNALKAKDPELLYEATALRAATESSPQYRKIFEAILEQSLAPEDMDELAKKLEGMKVVGNNTPKSTGRFGVIIGKSGKQGDSYRRTITVRREKAGWKVCDIGGEAHFESYRMRGRPRGRR